MKIFIYKFFIAIILLFSTFTSNSEEISEIKNLVIHEKQKKVENLSFKNRSNKDIFLNKYKKKLILINFWATWCEPCKEEMPSLDRLSIDSSFKSLEIIPINIGQENLDKIEKFYNEIDIKNLNIFYDTDVKLAKSFLLRGIPTTVIINKNGKEFARIIGSIDFSDQEFKNWLLKFD
tara:strand:+ start:14855 stop:15385 length:531 start_codon:yes stop_codon:yes gene_type:complete